MIEIRVPKEVTDYKAKLFFGLTTRQCISMGVALAINVPTYYFGRRYIPEDLLGWLIVLIATPLVLLGFFRYNGMPFEKIAVYFINHWVKSQRRPFVYEKSRLQGIREQLIKEDYIQRVATSKGLRSKYRRHLVDGIREERLYYKHLNEWKRGKTRKKNLRGKRSETSVI